ncbi:hypothetical protein [Epilithonimonas sp.]|uniref:hypothetical protein n=1 Tax=Epilithonimonas sp. TaxID=2894511 RepID=UPI00289E6A01|nr:hypothetical protein [Epilithonimonas sp.]
MIRILFLPLLILLSSTSVKAQGADIILSMDNSGSISSNEWTSQINSTKASIDKINPNNRAAIIHYAEPDYSTSATQIYIESDFSNIVEMPDDAFAYGLSVQPGGVLSSCGTVTVTASFGFTGPIATGYNNANHWSEMAIMLPGFLYTRVPNDPGTRTEVNNETNFNLQMTVTSSDGVVYWETPYIEADHSLKLVLKQDAVIPFGTIITWKATGLEIDDAQNYNGTVGINIYHAAVDGDDNNNYMEIPVSTNNQCNPVCYKPGISGTGLPTRHGISALGRAGSEDKDNWPMVQKGAWTALEAKTKGFVVNRIPTTAQLNAIPDPIEGMMVYDMEAKCLKVYTLKDGASAMAWHCLTNQACPSK